MNDSCGSGCGCGGSASAPMIPLPMAPGSSGPEGPGTLESTTPGSAESGDTHAAGCHGGRERLLAADTAEKSRVLEELVEDYPLGPHEQPQGMCPAFGSLRVGLRMRRTATVLSGSACCVYGLTFTSHFYGARRTVGYVPFNSETLVTGELFEDIERAMHELADPERYDAVIMTNLCIPTASGVPLDLLPDEIDGVRIVGIDVPGFGVPTHAEAKDVLTGAVLRYARSEVEDGPVARPRDVVEGRPTVTLIGELFPADPMGIDALLQPLGVSVGTVVPPREWRELYAALDGDVVGAVHPFYVRAIREFQAAGRPVIGSGPVGVDGTEAWLRAVGDTLGASAATTGAAVDAAVDATRGALERSDLEGRITVSGYEGSELLVARVLAEAGADVSYVGTALPRSEWSDPDREWLEARGAHVQYRASLEEDVAAFRDVDPDLVIGTHTRVQEAKEEGIPALYFTNLISARPIFGPAGAGALAESVGAAIGGRKRLARMRSFFAGVGEGHTAGYGFDEVPERRLSAEERHARARAGRSPPPSEAEVREARRALDAAARSLETGDEAGEGAPAPEAAAASAVENVGA